MSEMCDDILASVEQLLTTSAFRVKNGPSLDRNNAATAAYHSSSRNTAIIELPEDCVDEKKGSPPPASKDDGYGEWECVVETG